MGTRFSVSVIVPVYNAGQFIRRAVEHIIVQPEVSEIILVEDGSADKSLDICKKLESHYPIIKLFRHEGGVNLGAGATRNAGVRHATNEYIAFADADNFYLPNRFKIDKEIFDKDPSIDGVYQAQGVHYENDEAKQKFFDAGLGDAEFLSVSETIPPEELLRTMLGRHPSAKIIGGLGIDAITLRRRCFEKAGYFAPELKLQQDVYFFMKLAACCRMYPGNLNEPVALRGVHGNMRSTDSEFMDKCRRLRWELLNDWFSKNISDPEQTLLFKFAYTDFKIRDSRKFQSIFELVKCFFQQPRSLFHEYGRFDMNYLSIAEDSRFLIKLLSGKNRIFRSFKGRR